MTLSEADTRANLSLLSSATPLEIVGGVELGEGVTTSHLTT